MEIETLKVIRHRRSVRSYKPEQVRDEELQAVLEAGMYAPHAGEQSWHFTVVQDRELLKRLGQAAKESAKVSGIEGLMELGNLEEFDCLYGAPTLLIVSGDEDSPIPLDAECAAVMQNMLIAAESVGLSTCWIFFILMAFYSEKGVSFKEELKIPEGYKPYYAAVVGYGEGERDVPVDRKPGIVTWIR